MSVCSFIAVFLLCCGSLSLALFFSLSHSQSFLVCRDCPCLKHSYITVPRSCTDVNECALHLGEALFVMLERVFFFFLLAVAVIYAVIREPSPAQ